jgi:hypothetical protein
MEGVNSSMIYLIYYKNFHKCHNVPPPSITIKIIFKKLRALKTIENVALSSHLEHLLTKSNFSSCLKTLSLNEYEQKLGS